MRKAFKFITYLLLAGLTLSCAKTVAETDINLSIRTFEAWMEIHHPGMQKVGNGIYIVADEEVKGTGAEISDSNYVYYNYINRNLSDSAIVAYNEAEVAKKLNKYNPNTLYPEQVMFLTPSTTATLYEVIRGGGKYGRMREGGSRTVIIPSWIAGSSKVLDSEKEYISQAASGTHCIYTLKAVKQVKDIEKMQIGQIEDHIKSKGISIPDTTKHYGLYYIRNKAREEERWVVVDEKKVFPKDTTIYIEYIGRLLDGKVFDTNIKDTAIKYGLGTRTSKYTPMAVTWSADSTQLKTNSSSLIKGFCLTLWQMHPYESGTGIFTSKWGYGAQGTAGKIPPYSPLVFEIDIVDKP